MLPNSRSYLISCFYTFIAIFAFRHAAEAQPQLKLVSARDNIEGAFLIQQSVYADKDRIYLAAHDGKLFVLARDRANNFPLIQLIQEDSVPLKTITGDDEYIYVTLTNGYFRKYKKNKPYLQLWATRRVVDSPLSTVQIAGDSLFFSSGGAFSIVDPATQRLFVSQYNPGELTYEVSKSTLNVTRIFGQGWDRPFEANKIIVYDLATGNRVGSMDSPPGGLNIRGTKLMVTHGGCCGPIPQFFNTITFAEEHPDLVRYANDAVQTEDGFIGGNEGGIVQIVNFSNPYGEIVSEVSLRHETGHTGMEDIEVRALWKDDYDNLIFAGSSWGNDQSRGPHLPSFFVLEVIPGNETPPVQVQINSGGEEFIEGSLQARMMAVDSNPAGHFSKDSYFMGGSVWNFSSKNAVSGAGNNASLYRSVRYSDKSFRYLIPVPDGNYKMKLRFMEGDVGHAKKSPFSVAINGKVVLSRFDVASEAGGVNRALDLEFPVVASGNSGVTAVFSNDTSKGRAHVSAVELVSTGGSTNPVPTPTPAPQLKLLHAVNAGGGRYENAATGSKFEEDFTFYHSGGSPWTWLGQDISGTPETAALYKSVRYSSKNFKYMFPVAAGNYKVKLRFMEGDRSFIGKSPFTVKVNGEIVLNRFDVGTNAGGVNVALDHQFSAMAIGKGGVTVEFISNSSSGRAMVSAIELFSEPELKAAAGSKTAAAKKPAAKKPSVKKPAKPKKPAKKVTRRLVKRTR